MKQVSSGTPFPEHVAVDRLQDAARSGVPVLIPGAREPARARAAEPVQVVQPPLTVTQPVAPRLAMSVSELEACGTPTAPVTLRDKGGRLVVRLVEAFIRLLSSPSRDTRS